MNGWTVKKSVRYFADLGIVGENEFVERKEPDEWLDSKEVCEILCVSPRSLQHLRNSGTLSFTRIDKKIFYRKQDVVSLLTTVQKKK